MTYFKALVAVVVSAIGALTVALGTTSSGDFGDIDTQSWLIALAAVLGSGGLVWLVENTSAAPVAKAIMAFLSAGVASLIVALDDDVVSSAEWLTALSAAIVATGLVYQAKNAPDG